MHTLVKLSTCHFDRDLVILGGNSLIHKGLTFLKIHL